MLEKTWKYLFSHWVKKLDVNMRDLPVWENKCILKNHE